MKASVVTHFMHSRGFAALANVVAIAAILWYFCIYGVTSLEGDRGFALPSANEWLPAGWLNFGASIAVNAAVVVAALMNKVYNILRSMTGLYLALYGVIMLGTPGLFAQFYTGPMLALVVALGLLLLFGTYRSLEASGRVFLVFTMLSGLTATQYCYALYIPAFLIVCAQMRIFNLRTIIAAAFGIVTPWWILFGFGIVSLDDIHVPEFRNIFGAMDSTDMAMTLIAVGTSCLILILSMVLNIFKAIAYNAQSRAVNGAITIVAIFTMLWLFVDFTNFVSYVPLLSLCTAIQTAHYFSTHHAERSWIPIMAIFAVYIVLFVCQTQI